MVYAELPGRLLVRAVAFVGSCSYAIYLWHMPVHDWGLRVCQKRFGLDPFSVPGILLYGITSIVAGIVMTKLVEVPTLRLRDRFFPGRARLPALGTDVALPQRPIAQTALEPAPT
jgi:peptidoglycan/LPS O-acetylase OafA/YrhL